MGEIVQRMLRERVLASQLLASALMSNLLALISALYSMQVLNRYVSQGVDSTLATLTVGAVIAIVLEFAFRQLRHRLAREINETPNQEISIAAFTVLTRAKSFALGQLGAGKRREIANSVNEIDQAYTPANINAVLDVPFSLVFIIVLSLFSLTLALVAVFFIVAVSAYTVMKSAHIRDANQDLKAVNAQSGSILDTANRELETVRGFGAAPYLKRQWVDTSDVLKDLRDKIATNQALMQTVTQSSTAAMGILIICIGAVLVVRGDMDVGTMIGANILASRALQPISRFVGLRTSFEKAAQALAGLKEFVALPLEAEKGSAKSSYQGGIEFRDVAFFYPGSSSPLMESLSVTVAPGSLILVVGESGTGKTTLARLLIGLMDPVRGQILADGLDLRQVAPEWWRQQVVYFPQEPTFLNASIADNLRVLNGDLSDARLNEVINAAGLRSFIDESPDGFNTMIVDNGRQLAVGVRRQLALARALTSDGRLVVIDEMFDSLDSEASAAINSVVNAFVREGRTVFLMSHQKAADNAAITLVIDLNAKPRPEVSVTPPRAKPKTRRRTTRAKPSALQGGGHD